MTHPSQNLTEHTERALVGTGLDPAHAALAASGQQPADTAVSRALRDGWTAADRPRTGTLTTHEEATA